MDFSWDNLLNFLIYNCQVPEVIDFFHVIYIRINLLSKYHLGGGYIFHYKQNLIDLSCGACAAPIQTRNCMCHTYHQPRLIVGSLVLFLVECYLLAHLVLYVRVMI